MKIVVVGIVNGVEQYSEEANLGSEKLTVGESQKPICEAMDRIRNSFYADHPFNPFSGNPSAKNIWPDITFSFHSEYE